MTREIKFRSWDKVDKKMYAWENQLTEPLYLLNEKESSFVYMQYTGLKDKNGKEIYESDYLGEWCVFWSSGKYILQNISTGDIIDCSQITTYDKEITGNKYETPREHTAMETDL